MDARALLTEYTWEAGRMSYSVGSGGSAWALHLLASPPTSYSCPSLEAWWILATWGGDRQARHDAHSS